jgi:hypothetical protein
VKNKNNSRNNPNPQPVATETVTQERPAHIDNGTAERGSVNARENQTRTQPEPSPAVTALGDKVISMRPPKAARNDIFEQRRESLSGNGAEQHRILTVVRQQLAQAADLDREGGEKAKEGRKIADKSAIDLFNARANGVISADVLSALLGDSFGWKKKGGGDAPVKGGDPEASKTPFGTGEAIRKRVVRLVQAHEYVTGTDASKFYDGLPKEAVESELNRVRQGQVSLWQAYDNLGTIKRESVEKVEAAFNPKAIAKIVEDLRQPKAPQMFIDNPTLQDAYLALRDMLTEIGREAAQIAA